MNQCQICRQPESKRRGPIVACHGHPWTSHCTTCRDGCGQCLRGNRKPLYVQIEVSRQGRSLEATQTWHGWERVG